MKRYNLNDNYKAVMIGGSAGSFQPLTRILSELPADFPLPIFLCLHRLRHVRNGFVEALSIKSKKIIEEPYDKQTIKKGCVYLAPANYHMAIELGNSISLTTEDPVNNSRPGIDITLSSGAYVYKEKLISILLSGANKDGALGMKTVKESGGMTIIQDLEECTIQTMPASAKELTQIDYMLGVNGIVNFLNELHLKLITA